MTMFVMNMKYEHSQCVPTSIDVSHAIVIKVYQTRQHVFRNLFRLQETGQPDVKKLVS